MPEGKPHSALPDELLVYGHTADGLFGRVLRGRMTPRCLARLRDAGLDLSHVRAAYLLHQFERFLEIAGEELFPDQPLDAAQRHMGHLQVRGFAETPVGRATFGLLRLLGPRRMLDRLTHSWRGANNFVRATSTEVAPGHFEVWVNVTGRFPTGIQGILEEALKQIGCLGHRVLIQRTDGPSATFDIHLPPESKR